MNYIIKNSVAKTPKVCYNYIEYNSNYHFALKLTFHEIFIHHS